MIPHVVAIDLIRTAMKYPYRFIDTIHESGLLKCDEDMMLKRIQVMSSIRLLLDYKASDGEEITKDNIHETIVKCYNTADDRSWVNSVVVGYHVDCDKNALTILVANDHFDRDGESIDFAHRKDRDVRFPYGGTRPYEYEKDIRTIAENYIRDNCISSEYFINTPYCKNVPDGNDHIWWSLRCYDHCQLSYGRTFDIKTLVRLLKMYDGDSTSPIDNLDRVSYYHVRYAIERALKFYLTDYNDGDITETLKDLV